MMIHPTSMPLNVNRPAYRYATAAILACLAPGSKLAGQTPCSAEAAALIGSAWQAYRADSIETADERFARADGLCRRNLDAKVGLGYTALRQGRLRAADSVFRIVTGADSTNADGWDGLSVTAYRRGDRQTALRAAQRALKLNPGNQDVRDLLLKLDPDWERAPRGAPIRPSALAVPARTRGDHFEVPDGSGWSRFFIKGVNMGVALPGKFPSEFPTDSTLYAGWLDTIATMGANSLRVYTILPATFYRAVRGWNLTHPNRALWLIHGVWTELPPGDDFDNREWKAQFRAEMRRVVDLLHGAASIPVRPGHAGGRYDADVSRWTLAYIIGREWEPFAVKAFDAKHRGTSAYRGRFLEVARGGAMDLWMAAQCDYLLGYEMDTWNAIRPIAYTNWPTLDPLSHITESNKDEERAWRKKAGRVIPGEELEYENDAISLDAMVVRSTAKNPAGWFASFHAYPYYPDFMVLDPDYNRARSSEGLSTYFGYLKELVRHHAGIPLVIAEYGVPSSRGMAHWQPQGWHHGGHDEMDQAHIDARLTREIRESGAAGGIIFAWIDEWFKKNWIVVDYEIPLENTRQWHNLMDAEQNYGILGMYAGEDGRTPVPGGEVSQWLALPVLQRNRDAAVAAPVALGVGWDESYVYLAVELEGMKDRPIRWDSAGLRIALDTYRRDRGQHQLPGGIVSSDIGFEFLADFRSPDDAQLLITPDYNQYAGANAIVNGDDYGAFARRPVTITSRDDGRLDSLFVITNRARFGRDGSFFPSMGYNRGRLRFGTAQASSLSDWYYDQTAGLLELRLPWALLNVSDPSTGTLLFEEKPPGGIGTAQSDGFRIGVYAYGKANGGGIIGALPALNRDGRWSADEFETWTWPTWDAPHWHQRLKPVYDSLAAVWDNGKD